MPSLVPNLVKRIQRLPKPTNVATALQPLFEAISNAIHSTQTKFGEHVTKKGRVEVNIQLARKKDAVMITVEDNGEGLNAKNFEAFQTTDTDNKISYGGKGVGRLLWLDCFESIHVESVFKDKDQLKKRSFDFVLTQDEQLKNYKVTKATDARDATFFVRFTGVRDNGYRAKFPGRDSFIRFNRQSR